jgi:hypothetical protein
MGTPSSRIRFWSAAPPRTLKAAEKSEVEITPGMTSIARSTSPSARPGSRLRSRPVSSTIVAPACSSNRARSRAALTRIGSTSTAATSSSTTSPTVSPASSRSGRSHGP